MIRQDMIEQRVSPTRARALAEQLAQRANTSRPIQAHSQGLSKLAEALAARSAGKEADKAEQDQRRILSGIMAGDFTTDDRIQAMQTAGIEGLDPFTQMRLQTQMSREAGAKPIEVNGQLVDPSSGRVLGDYRDQNTGEWQNAGFNANGQPLQQHSLTGEMRVAGRTDQPAPQQGMAAPDYSAVPADVADAMREEQERASKENMQVDVQLRDIDNVISKVGDAINDSGAFSTGMTGAATSRVPNSPAYNLRAAIESIKANIGFDRLQLMRDMSPTGGALGQVAVQELNALQNSIASLDPNQSEEILDKNLEKVREHYLNWRNIILESSGVTSNDVPDVGSMPNEVNWSDL